MMINIYAAWLGFLLGCVAGVIPGLFFYDRDWLGGYSFWPRRMMRLAHISFFGIGFLNLSLALTSVQLRGVSGYAFASSLMLVGAVTMPTVCYLSAWRPVFRHLLAIPALSVTVSIAVFAWHVVIR